MRKKKPANPYATNKGGKIEGNRNPSAGDPKVTRKSGNDLRIKGGK
ncbi:MAG: hypothetical protein IKT56_02850 [Clostridia bacterium]|nr:hypothetical protein [Clostridia bacterium]